MKTKDIAAKYKINHFDFDKFIEDSKLPHTTGMMSISIEDSKVEEYVALFHKFEQDKAAAKQSSGENRELGFQELEKAKIRAATSQMLITSGFTFDGYRITKYSGYISGDDAISVERGVGFAGFSTVDAREKLLKSLAQIRRNALQELKEAAYNLGCNAVIGVDFDYITLDPQTATLGGGTQYQPYVFCVTANGNAVVIEKIEE